MDTLLSLIKEYQTVISNSYLVFITLSFTYLSLSFLMDSLEKREYFNKICLISLICFTSSYLVFFYLITYV